MKLKKPFILVWLITIVVIVLGFNITTLVTSNEIYSIVSIPIVVVMGIIGFIMDTRADTLFGFDVWEDS